MIKEALFSKVVPWLVELKVSDGWVEIGDLQWEELKVGLNDIVVSWHNGAS